MRAGIYLDKNIEYRRRKDFEMNDCHVFIIDVKPSLTLMILAHPYRPLCNSALLQTGLAYFIYLLFFINVLFLICLLFLLNPPLRVEE